MKQDFNKVRRKKKGWNLRYQKRTKPKEGHTLKGWTTNKTKTKEKKSKVQ